MIGRTLENAVEESRVIVCTGTGGVGKTTLSAAIALESACRGRRTLVLTIDPARRLADALGVSGLGRKPTAVDLSRVSPSANSCGSLDAMVLDSKLVFDALVERFAPNPTARERVLQNRIYRHLSGAVAGTAEFAAMLQVRELIEEGNYDLVVVDTPPADHALDFLRAPQRVRKFLESPILRSLGRPAAGLRRVGALIVGRGLGKVLSLIERIAGRGFLNDLADFADAIKGLSSGRDERRIRFDDFLLRPTASFVLVCSGHERSKQSTLEFLTKLESLRVPLVAVVANRLNPWPLESTPNATNWSSSRPEMIEDANVLADALDDPNAGTTVAHHLEQYAKSCASQQETLNDLESASRDHDVETLRIPEQSAELDELDHLRQIARSLFPLHRQHNPAYR